MIKEIRVKTIVFDGNEEYLIKQLNKIKGRIIHMELIGSYSIYKVIYEATK